MAAKLLCFGALASLTWANPLPPIGTIGGSSLSVQPSPDFPEIEEIIIDSPSLESPEVSLKHYLNATCPSTAIFEYHFAQMGIRPPSPGNPPEIRDTTYAEMQQDIKKLYASRDTDPGHLVDAQGAYAAELMNQYRGVKYAMDKIQEKLDIVGLNPKPQYTDDEEERHTVNDDVRARLIRENAQLKSLMAAQNQRLLDVAVVTGGSFIAAGVTFGMMTYSQDALISLSSFGTVAPQIVLATFALVIATLTGVVITWIQEQRSNITPSRAITLQTTLQGLRFAKKVAQDLAAKTRSSDSPDAPFIADADLQSVSIEMEPLLRSTRSFGSELVSQSQDETDKSYHAYNIEDLINLEEQPTRCKQGSRTLDVS